MDRNDITTEEFEQLLLRAEADPTQLNIDTLLQAAAQSPSRMGVYHDRLMLLQGPAPGPGNTTDRNVVMNPIEPGEIPYDHVMNPGSIIRAMKWQMEHMLNRACTETGPDCIVDIATTIQFFNQLPLYVVVPYYPRITELMDIGSNRAEVDAYLDRYAQYDCVLSYGLSSNRFTMVLKDRGDGEITTTMANYGRLSVIQHTSRSYVGAPEGVPENDISEEIPSDVPENDAPEGDAPSGVPENDVPEGVPENDTREEAPSDVPENDAPEGGAPSDVPENDVPEGGAPSDVPEIPGTIDTAGIRVEALQRMFHIANQYITLEKVVQLSLLYATMPLEIRAMFTQQLHDISARVDQEELVRRLGLMAVRIHAQEIEVMSGRSHARDDDEDSQDRPTRRARLDSDASSNRP